VKVGCPGTWGLKLPTPTQVARAPQKPALPATSHEPCQPYPAPAQAPVTQSQEFSGNNDNSNYNNNNNNGNSNKVIKNKRERRAGENTKTLRKLIRSPQTPSTVKLRPHVIALASNSNNNR